MPDIELTNIPASRVPIAIGKEGMITREWYRFFFNLFNIAGGGQANSAASSSFGQDLAPAYTPQMSDHRYGSFYDTTTQIPAAINTAYAITFNTTAAANATYIGSPTSRVYVDVSGVYNFEFSLQIDKTAGAVGYIWIWARVNGTDVADSATRVAVQGTTAEVVPSWNFMLELNGGDYFQLMWAVDDDRIHVQAEAATAFCPAVPSAILTVSYESALR